MNSQELISKDFLFKDLLGNGRTMSVSFQVVHFFFFSERPKNFSPHFSNVPSPIRRTKCCLTRIIVYSISPANSKSQWLPVSLPVWVPSLFSRVQLFVTLQTIARQAPLSMESSRQEYWSGQPFPTPVDLPSPGIEPASPVSPALQADSLPLSHCGSPEARIF